MRGLRLLRSPECRRDGRRRGSRYGERIRPAQVEDGIGEIGRGGSGRYTRPCERAIIVIDDRSNGRVARYVGEVGWDDRDRAGGVGFGEGLDYGLAYGEGDWHDSSEGTVDLGWDGRLKFMADAAKFVELAFLDI